jgi:hypothetical protein
MHFHLPKPIHGWRQFVGEVGIIVIGVLIALGAEQLVEEWHWERKAEAARVALMQELALNAGVFDERALEAKCFEENLANLSDLLRVARHSGRLPSIGQLWGPANRPVVTAEWNAVTADGTVSHLPAEFRKTLSVVYPLIADYPRDLDNEQQLWSAVRLAQNAEGPISETLLTDISTSLVRLRYETALNDAVAQQSLDLLLKAGVTPNYWIPVDEGASRSDLVKSVQRDGCKPLLVDGKPLPAR